MKPRFLEGIRFVDLTWAGAGPFSTKIFSDFGAEIIKVESVSRADPVRLGGPFKDGVAGLNRSGYFASRNTGKKSLALNLKNEEARGVVRELIRHGDVVSNNFGPGAMERLGFGYEDVKAIKPDIIYLAMPMYGEDGPLSSLLGVGMTISAVTGLMWLTGHEGGPPIGPGTHFPDHAANPYHAAFAVLAALRLRRRTGQGMKIDLAQVESTINVMGLPVTEQAATGVEPERIGNRSHCHAPHNIFRCKGEDAWCAVAALDDAQWRSLCAAIGRADLAADEGLNDDGRPHRPSRGGRSRSRRLDDRAQRSRRHADAAGRRSVGRGRVGFKDPDRGRPPAPLSQLLAAHSASRARRQHIPCAALSRGRRTGRARTAPVDRRAYGRAPEGHP